MNTCVRALYPTEPTMHGEEAIFSIRNSHYEYTRGTRGWANNGDLVRVEFGAKKSESYGCLEWTRVTTPY